jgi:cysteine synthase A
VYGILPAICRGGAGWAPPRLAALPEFVGKTFVVVLPDSGERYLSGPLFEGAMAGVAEAKAGDTI